MNCLQRKVTWLARLAALAAILVLVFPLAGAQQPVDPPRAALNLEEFNRAADEVLTDISKIVGLPLKSELKKSLRSRQEIRDYLIRRIEEEKRDAKWDADQKMLEKFGLIPKGFELEKFLIELLTEQIAGLYDPKGKEFYVADWIPVDGQREVMAHEFVHALHDQYFDVDTWLKAARPDDDALSARNAVLEGAAMAAMVDYIFREQGMRVQDMAMLESLIRASMLSSTDPNSAVARAPIYIREALLFPYLSGTTFAQKVLAAGEGWKDFNRVFEKPPVTTQQILHPEHYLSGYAPRPVPLPLVERAAGRGWRKLDQNQLGEFGLRSVLKQYLGEKRSVELGSTWSGDQYAIFDSAGATRTLLVLRLRLESEESAARFFGAYSELLELKYTDRAELFRRPNFFAFETGEGGVYLRCFIDECVTIEGGDRRVLDSLMRAFRWPPAPSQSRRPAGKTIAAEPASRPVVAGTD